MNSNRVHKHLHPAFLLILSVFLKENFVNFLRQFLRQNIYQFPHFCLKDREFLLDIFPKKRHVLDIEGKEVIEQYVEIFDLWSWE